MRPAEKQASSEREQTDESLRTEREKADRTLQEELTAIDETADAVISQARERADQVIATARAKTDRCAKRPDSGIPPSGAMEKERGIADRELQRERADADEALRNERAEHLGALSLERGATDKDLSSERAQSDTSLAMRDEFLSIVSHELRNQLNTMSLFARLITEGVAQENHTAQVLDHAQRIQRAGARMSRLIGDLLDVAGIDAGLLAVRREVGDVVEVVSEAVNSYEEQAATSQVSLTTEIVGPLSPVSFDPARILQVLINLLSNAIKFTPPHGKVSVRLECSDGQLHFAISDTGLGIPADKLETVFERFVQVADKDRRGVGLGLYISKCIVQGHGGRIWAESVMGQGSTFCFDLPLAGASVAPPA